MLRDLAVIAAVFAVVTGLATLLGATDLGTAMTFGQVAFIGVATLLMLGGSAAR